MLIKIDQDINANLWEWPYILREMVTKLGYPTLVHFTHNNVPILGRTFPKVLKHKSLSNQIKECSSQFNVALI